tara:strand:- start:759 stop:1712 length:954 start_codon:yes stop_codon:yes gene_type:complete
MSCWDARDLWAEIESGTKPLPGNPDLVHSNSFLAPTLSPAVPLIYTIHDLTFWTHPEYTSERNRIVCQGHLLKALKNADAFIFVSQTSKNDFEEVLPDWLESSEKPHRVIRSGSRFTAKTSNPNRFQNQNAPWLYVGSIEPRKNIEGLLATYRDYCLNSESPRPLTLIGGAKWHSEPIIEQIQEAAKELPITYHGYLDDDTLAEHFANAFALLFPSHYEGFGLPVIEAMSFGLPTICQDLPSLREFSEGAAIFTDFTQAETASSELLKLEREQTLYNSLSKTGLESVSTQNWDKTAVETLEFYKEVLASRIVARNED